ncbi:TetR/AcrR family transcriptional regulator [Neptunomonas phycophila]|uniref:TetR/AcrR family transcriptional regulator n=1 Tax=Neptunomonas phycophila TaxID=1572645 RepID=UPI003734FCDB
MRTLSMPYTKTHKSKTRNKILECAFRLFAIKGFNGVTIDEVMNNGGLTRGGFYAHFTSKAELYSEALKFAATSTKLANLKPNHLSDQQWLCLLLNEYLSVEHVQGKHPCPLAFLATDINIKNDEVNTAYANTYQGMNTAIMEYAKSYTRCDEQDILSVTAMIIGAVAIARTLKDQVAIENLLAACRREAGAKLGGV